MLSVVSFVHWMEAETLHFSDSQKAYSRCRAVSMNQTLKLCPSQLPSFFSSEHWSRTLSRQKGLEIPVRIISYGFLNKTGQTKIVRVPVCQTTTIPMWYTPKGTPLQSPISKSSMQIPQRPIKSVLWTCAKQGGNKAGMNTPQWVEVVSSPNTNRSCCTCPFHHHQPAQPLASNTVEFERILPESSSGSQFQSSNIHNLLNRKPGF